MGLLYIRGRVLVYEGAVQQRRQAATVLAGCALSVCVILPVPLSVDHDSELCWNAEPIEIPFELWTRWASGTM